jgi:hypothetical protein
MGWELFIRICVLTTCAHKVTAMSFRLRLGKELGDVTCEGGVLSAYGEDFQGAVAQYRPGLKELRPIGYEARRVRL